MAYTLNDSTSSLGAESQNSERIKWEHTDKQIAELEMRSRNLDDSIIALYEAFNGRAL